MTIEFRAWKKTPRLNRDITVTEKIDGTNACVIVEQHTFGHQAGGMGKEVLDVVFDPLEALSPDRDLPCFEYHVGAQSSNRLITPGKDHFGFAQWVVDNAEALVAVLGVGRHYGEWWGSGIQRGYGLPRGERRFSLFDKRYAHLIDPFAVPVLPPGLDVVPVLYEGPFSQFEIDWALNTLRLDGSVAAPGFKNAEGVIVYHSASKQVYKALIEGDDEPKGAA